MNSPRTPKFTPTNRTCSLPLTIQEKNVPSNPEILLIEDGSGLFSRIGAMLQNGGFRVILAPDADAGLRELANPDIVAVIASASREQFTGLHILAACKERRAGVKTLVVTRLVNPELPLQAYEMDIDDYLHWPLSSAELSNRLKSLLELGKLENLGDPGHLEESAGGFNPFAALGSLVEHFTDSLSLISQSLEDLRQEYLNDMPGRLSEELSFTAAQIQSLGDNMRRCWRLGAAEPVSRPKRSRFH